MIYTNFTYFSSDFKLLREKYPEINIWMFADNIVTNDYFGWKTKKVPYDGVFQDNKNNIYIYKKGGITNSFKYGEWEKYISRDQKIDDLNNYIYD